MIEILIGLICFFVFVILQGLFINGLKSSMEEGMILEGYLKWVKRTFNEYWQKPMGTCIKCLASIVGFITYWPSVITVFGYRHWMIPVFIVDVFILAFISWYIYKRI